MSTIAVARGPAEVYDEFFVPALFSRWGPVVAEAADIRPGERVLDVACGTGALTLAAAERVGPGGSVVGLDVNPEMLAVARRKPTAIEWIEGRAEAMPLPNSSFDAVVSQFGLMFFSDRREALRQALRVLTPEGCLAVAVWDSLDHIPAYAAEVALLERLAGRRAADALRAPFVLGDHRDLVTLFAEAGVASVEVTTDQGRARFPSARVMVEADLRGWLPVMGVVLPEEQIARILEEAELVLRPYVSTDGTVAFDTSAHIITGKKV